MMDTNMNEGSVLWEYRPVDLPLSVDIPVDPIVDVACVDSPFSPVEPLSRTSYKSHTTHYSSTYDNIHYNKITTAV